jgi:AcrR family transcriptional regulator
MGPRASVEGAGLMPAPARRRLPAAERRALILDAALNTFAAHGYDGAAMDEIATAAGVTKAVVYDHVASKRELYTQLLDAIRNEIERTIDDALRSPGTEGEERVRAATEAVYRYAEERPVETRLLVLELQGANVSPIGRELEERIAHGIAGTLGGDPGLFDGHPERALQLSILAELLKSAVLGLIAWWYRHPGVPRGDLVDRSVAVIWPAIERALGDAMPTGA